MENGIWRHPQLLYWQLIKERIMSLACIQPVASLLLTPGQTLVIVVRINRKRWIIKIFFQVFFYCDKIHTTKFTILSILIVQFGGIKYVHNVQPSPPSISMALSSYKTETLYSLNNNLTFP